MEDGIYKPYKLYSPSWK